MSFDWKSIVGTVAPTIATALGGPLAGMATKAIAGALGLESDAGEDQVAEAMKNADPATLLKIKEADNNFKIEMRKLGVDVMRLEVQDRHSARDYAKTDASRTTTVLAYLMFVLVAVCLYVAIEIPLQSMAKDLLFMVIGSVMSGLSMVLSFYFGSSSSSQAKDDMMRIRETG